MATHRHASDRMRQREAFHPKRISTAEERLDIEHYVDAVLRSREKRKSDVQRAEEYLEARLKGGVR